MKSENIYQTLIRDKVYILCPTLSEAKKVLHILDQSGFKWHGGDSYIDLDNWSQYGKETCYYPYEGRYCSIRTAIHNRGTIITAKEFIDKSKMVNKSTNIGCWIGVLISILFIIGYLIWV